MTEPVLWTLKQAGEAMAARQEEGVGPMTVN